MTARVVRSAVAPLLPREGERLLPLLSALLLLLSFPPLHLLLPPFVALVPFGLFVERLPRGDAGAQAALRGGMLLGLVYFGGLLYWILVALLGVTVLALPVYLATTGMLAALLGAVGWSLHRLRHRVGAPLWLALPLVWTAGEWLRAHLPGSLAFPWLGLGTSLTAFPELVGIAELVGARGVTFWIALVAGLVTELLLRRRDGRGWTRMAVVLLLVLVVPAGWGIWRARSLALRPVARVAVVQPEIPQELRLDRELATGRTLSALSSPELRPRSGSVDLVAWPETVFPLRFLGAEGREARRFVGEYSRRVGAPVLLGAFGSSDDVREERHNSAFLVDSAGPTGFVYHKHFLVPMVERTPLVPASALPDGAGRTDLSAGVTWPVGRLEGGARFGVLICYEAAFARASRAYRLRGAEFLVNITNDAWYGLNPGDPRTTALWQHPAHLVMRAIETRAGVARAANGGISFFVDPLGRTYGNAPLHGRAVRLRTVYTTDVTTLYVRIGDLVGTSAAGAVFLLVLAAGWRGLDSVNKNRYK